MVSHKVPYKKRTKPICKGEKSHFKTKLKIKKTRNADFLSYFVLLMYAGRTSLLKIPSTKDEQTKRTLCKLVLQVVLSYIFTEERNKTDFGRFTLRLCPAIIHPY